MAARQTEAATPTATDPSSPAFTALVDTASGVANSSDFIDPNKPSPETEEASKKLAEWVALGVLGLYVLLALIILLNWFILRMRSNSSHSSNALPPEATEKGKNAFLVPTPVGAHDPRSRSPAASRPGSSRSRTRASSVGSNAPRRPNRPAAGLQLQSDSGGSTRSGFYSNGGAAQSNQSVSNPFANSAAIQPSPLREDSNWETRGVRASRASSIASARFYHAEGGHNQATAPQMPPIAHMQNGRW